MSDDKTAILIRALEASGSEREAQLARAILGDAPAQPAAPAEPAEVQELAAEQANLPTPPPGKAQLRSLDDWEALPEKEQLERMGECDALLRGGHK